MAGPSGIDTNELQSETRYLIRQPRALQWFEHGRLVKRRDEERQAGRFELFLDLLYVAILSNFADTLTQDISGAKLAKYIIWLTESSTLQLILAPSWHVWSDLREVMNAFYNDDLLQRVLILWIMALMVVYGNNAPLVDEDISAMRSAVGSYMAARLSLSCMHLYNSFASYQHRPQQRLWAGLSVVTLAVYTPLYFESVSIRGKIAAAAVAVVFE
ncbi:bacterial low temperature requirement A protein-domain-containing protein [Penicillium sp. IBT 16267x]|nr:bacterial low temperature requirement A protein-domain-containing protein [Penicillium sp. IBT 16267x]